MAGSIGLQTSGAGAAIRRLVAAAPPLTRLFRLLMYGTSATAQPQLDNDYYYHHDDDGSKQKESEAVPVLDTEGLVPTRGVQWAFIGNPSAKKHVYAEKISKLLEVPRISVASLVRQDLSPSSSIYKQIADAVNQGKLVSEEIMFGLLSKRLEDGYYKGETGFILDGIPQTQIQAEILEKLVDIDLVVNFKCPEDCLLEHHGDSVYSHSHQSNRFSGFGCGSLNMVSRSAQTKYSFCNEKAHIYHKQMKPVEDYYKKQNKLIDFQVGRAPGETWRGLLAALHLQHINAAHCRLTSASGSTGL